MILWKASFQPQDRKIRTSQYHFRKYSKLFA